MIRRYILMTIHRIQLTRSGKKRFTPVVVAMEERDSCVSCYGLNKVDGVFSIHLCDEGINEDHDFRLDIPEDKMKKIVAYYIECYRKE
jgi:hypothetical protein